MMKSICAALMLLAFASYASCIRAQECPEGIPSAGNPECLPPDDANSPYYQGDRNGQPSQPAQAPAVWAKRWGAIAIDDTSSVGVSENQTSKSAATAEALQRCASKSNNQSCKISLAYYNQCAALAWGTKYESTAGALGIKQAQENALASCSQGAPDCKIVYSACSLPVRVQ